MASPSDKTKPYYPLSSCHNEDAYSNEDEATATCLCGAVQLAFPTKPPGLIETFMCHCPDCHKLSASMFISNFTVYDTHLKHIRGHNNLKSFTQSKTVARHQDMTNYFCNTCGVLMYRVGAAFPGMSILRIGSVDDFNLFETKLRPQKEQFTKYRVGWLEPVAALGAEQFSGDCHPAEDGTYPGAV